MLRHRSVWQDVSTIFIISVLLNYPWERAQSLLYTTNGMPGSPWWECFVMSLGDGLLVLLIFGAGWKIFGGPAWFRIPGSHRYVVMFAAGLLISIPMEWIIVHVFERWAYTPHMPLIPGLGVGATPVLQMLILPPIIFHVTAHILLLIPNRTSQQLMLL